MNGNRILKDNSITLVDVLLPEFEERREGLSHNYLLHQLFIYLYFY